MELYRKNQRANRRSSATLYLIAVATLIVVSQRPAAWPDEWGWPPSQHSSDNGRFLLRVGTAQRSLALLEKGPQGISVRWSVAYPETGVKYGDTAPVAAYIADDGRYVVLRDVWGRVGYGKVLVFLGPKGGILSVYTLDQLLTKDEIMQYKVTVSSLWWSEHALFFLRPGQTQFAFVTQYGTVRVFDLKTGGMLALTAGRRRGVRGDAIALARKNLSSSDPDERATAATTVGVLGDKDSVPRLRELLDDTSSRGTVGPPMHPFYEVQAAAGEAIAALLGVEAAPLLEVKLSEANPQMARRWAELLGKVGAARNSPGVKRLARDEDATTRLIAVMAMLEGDDGSIIHENAQWLRDEDQRVRWQAIHALANHARAEDAGALRAALLDKDANCAETALDGLVRLNVPDLDILLRESLHRSPYLAFAATLHLARRGDSDALNRIVQWVQGLERGVPKGAAWGPFQLAEMCRILVRRRPPGTLAALRAASKNQDSTIQRDTAGALACLGDKRALTRIRALARSGDYLERAPAIEWLGTCKDGESLGFLREQLSDREPVVRDAARQALEEMR
jgi:HEAT repeat protein